MLGIVRVELVGDAREELVPIDQIMLDVHRVIFEYLVNYLASEGVFRHVANDEVGELEAGVVEPPQILISKILPQLRPYQLLLRLPNVVADEVNRHQLLIQTLVLQFRIDSHLNILLLLLELLLVVRVRRRRR